MDMTAILEEEKAANRVLSTIGGSKKNRIVKKMAYALRVNTPNLLEENALLPTGRNSHHCFLS